MICYQCFWYLYLLTLYLREDFMLWTFDIIEDHFGFMLVWGDLIYVPFLYSIAGWFAADNVHQGVSHSMDDFDTYCSFYRSLCFFENRIGKNLM